LWEYDDPPHVVGGGRGDDGGVKINHQIVVFDARRAIARQTWSNP
jgi:hypothetical protein